MLYGTPTPRFDRATPDGALALFVRTFGGAGQHRSAPRTPERTAQLLVRALAALIVLGLVAMTALFMVSGRRPAGAGDSTSVLDSELLASRTADTTPLTITEVFPDQDAVHPADARPYRITFTQSDADCRTATSGEMGSLLS